MTDEAPRTRAAARLGVIADRSAGAIKVLVCLAGFLVAFDDIAPLRTVGGGFGASPAWIPLLLCGLLLGRRGIGRWRHAVVSLWIMGLVVTLLTFLVLPEEMRGVNTYVKALAVGIPIAVFLTIIVIAARLAAYDPRLIVLFGLISLGTLLAFGALDMLGVIPNGKSAFLHGLDNLNQRARGSRFEASALGAGVLIALATAAYRVRTALGALGVLAAAIVLSLLLPSRGTLVAGLAFCATIGVVLLAWRLRGVGARFVPGLTAGVLAIITLVGGFALGFLTPSLKAFGLSYSTSDAVRSVWSDVGMDVALRYPVGMGYSAPLEWLPSFVQASMDQFAGRYQPSDFDELMAQLQAQGGYGFSPKTMPALIGVYFGAIGVLLLVAMWLMIGKRAGDATRDGYLTAIPAAVVLCLIAATYFSSIYAWEQAFLLGALLALRHPAPPEGPGDSDG